MRIRNKRREKSVFVKNGVNVRKRMVGSEKGEYFAGKVEEQGTFYVNSAVRAWRIVFDVLDTKQRMYVDFTRQMWIGRNTSGQEERAKLNLSGDTKVSRVHCTIYEDGDRLCLQDLKSRNHTYVNGTVIREAVCLQNGDIIQVGNTRMRVLYTIISNRPT